MRMWLEVGDVEVDDLEARSLDVGSLEMRVLPPPWGPEEKRRTGEVRGGDRARTASILVDDSTLSIAATPPSVLVDDLGSGVETSASVASRKAAPTPIFVTAAVLVPASAPAKGFAEDVVDFTDFIDATAFIDFIDLTAFTDPAFIRSDAVARVGMDVILGMVAGGDLTMGVRVGFTVDSDMDSNVGSNSDVDLEFNLDSGPAFGGAPVRPGSFR